MQKLLKFDKIFVENGFFLPFWANGGSIQLCSQEEAGNETFYEDVISVSGAGSVPDRRNDFPDADAGCREGENEAGHRDRF